jgi:SAM-dependent methyltransferase
MNERTDPAVSALRDHWDQRAAAGGDDCTKVDTSARSQRWRFDMFAATAGDLTGRSVLDVGCGVGDFYPFLQGAAPSAQYHGMDISPAMVRRASERFPEGRFEVADLLEGPAEMRWDHVVAFGVFNVRLEGADALLPRLLRRQFECARISAHVSLLTSEFRGFDAKALHWDPRGLFDLALSITPYVVVRHDYLPHDFSVTLFREPLADRAPRP